MARTTIDSARVASHSPITAGAPSRRGRGSSTNVLLRPVTGPGRPGRRDRTTGDPDTGPVARARRTVRTRPRRRHRLRTVLLALLAAAGVVTAASVVYNTATRTPPAPPAGLAFVQAGDVSTRVLRWGDHGSPVVLVPGAFETADAWHALGEALGSDHRVFAFDLTGQGYSQTVPPFDVDHDVRQTLALARALGLT
ncbi:MAG: alpha/beta fold hydrolase, partial [Propionibacteriaceae bacterium]